MKTCAFIALNYPTFAKTEKKNISGESLAFDFAFFLNMVINYLLIRVILIFIFKCDQMSSEQLPFEKTHLIFNGIIGYIEMHQILLFNVN